MTNKTRLLLMGVSCLAFFLLVGCERPWQIAHRRGVKALEEDRYHEAESHLKRALVMTKTSPYQADVLDTLTKLYYLQARYQEAEAVALQSLAIRERHLGAENLDLARSLFNLAAVYSSQHKLAEAEPLYRRSLAIREKTLGPEHPDVARVLNNLADLYRAQRKYGEAEPLFRRALAVSEKAGPEHPDVAVVLEDYATLLRETNRQAEAIEMETRAKAIRAKQAKGSPRK